MLVSGMDDEWHLDALGSTEQATALCFAVEVLDIASEVRS